MSALRLTPSALLTAPLALVAALAAPLCANAGEYRQLTLTDGRVLAAEVLETKPAGLSIRTVQGDSLIIFEILLDMAPIDESKYHEQQPWVVYLHAPEALQGPIGAVYDAIPGVDVIGRPGTEDFINEENSMFLSGCEGDFDCINAISTDVQLPWMWVIKVTVDAETNALSFKGKVNLGKTRSEGAAPDVEDIELLAPAIYQTMNLNPPKKLPKEVLALAKPEKEPTKRPPKVRPPKDPVEMSRKRVVALSFVPVPGLPSLIQRDYASFGIALGVVVPTTALWVGAVGKNAQSTPEFAMLSFGGYYVATVAVNELLGMHSFNKTSVIVDGAVDNDGATVRISGSF
ncbi:MAG: hypothetical protein HN348_13885 [Proteobacteria bacterium]|nr:hypothetical protein [Pseudomonadota bacterium]